MVSFEFVAMGGPCRVHIDAPRLPAAVETALIEEVQRLEHKYSRYRSDSVVSALNAGRLNGCKLDAETTALLNYAQQCHQLSDGLFDVTVGVLRNIWNFKHNRLPDTRELDQVLQNIGWDCLAWDGNTLAIPPTMELDLGGVVKEFAVDRLIAILEEAGQVGLVNLAGDIAVTGLKKDGQPWLVAVANPRDPEQPIAAVKLHSGALACSGDYERFITVEGQRYCHILRPDTGFPVVGGLASATVVAEKCILAGAVSTVAMLKPKAEALAWLDEMELPYLAIDQSLLTYGRLEAN